MPAAPHPVARAAAVAAALLAPAALRAQAATHLPPPPVDVRAPMRGADSLRAERLAALGRAWMTARLFHPALADRGAEWDTALVRALPAARAATTRAEFARASAALFATLDDPATRVVPRPRPATLYAGALTEPAAAEADSALVVTMRHPDQATQFEPYLAALQALAPRLRAARRVVLDLRAADSTRSTEELLEVFEYANLAALLVDRPVPGLPSRRRAWSGWPAEGGGGYPGYASGWREDDGLTLRPRPGLPVAPPPDRRVAILVNARTALPAALLALRAAGLAYVVADGPVGDPGPAGAARLPLDDSSDVLVRTRVLRWPDGRARFAADTVVTPAAGDPAMAAAHAWVRAGGPPPPAGRPASAAAEVAPTPPPPATAGGARTQPLEWRLLAAFKLWGVMEYFHAYRALYHDDWYAVLTHLLPRYEAAADSVRYGRAVEEHVAHIRDSHGFVANSQSWRPAGRGMPALRARLLGDALVVTATPFPDSVGGVRPGDVLETVDGVRPRDYVTRVAHLRASSNAWTRDRSLGPDVLRGPQGVDAVVRVRTGAGPLRTARLPRRDAWTALQYEKQRTGPVWRRLAPAVGYVDLDRLTEAQVDSAVDALADARAIVWDMRGYPNGTGFVLPRRLTTAASIAPGWFSEPRPDAPRTVSRDPAAPTEAGTGSTYTWVERLPGGGAGARVWRGRSVVLVDEHTQSQAEGTVKILAAASPGTRLVGSPSAGANGDVTNVVLPGGIRVSFSGHDVRWPDGRQLQQVGLRPDVLVRPTVAGIRAGRDEVLEAGLAEARRLLGAPGGGARTRTAPGSTAARPPAGR